MTLNLNKIGRPVCKIVGGKYEGHIVSISDTHGGGEIATKGDGKGNDNALIKEFKQLNISKDSKLQHTISPNTERQILHITGCSGSGKSTYTRKYLEQYKKQYKNNPIYLFSSLKEDKSLDAIKPKRIIIDESLVTDPIDIEELADSCCIFDDIDVINPEKLKKAVYALLNKVLEIGRHHNITAVVTAHLPSNGHETRRILSESSSNTYFPHSTPGKIKDMLKNHVGIDRDTFRKFKKLNSRYITIFRHYPQLYLSENSVGLLNESDDD